MKKIFCYLLVIVVLSVSVFQLLDVMRYPEMYSTTAKYQLKQDIERGNEAAIKYYKEVYLDNGITLFEV